MNPSVLRLLDANANRAREALRVMEDYARFTLNDNPLCTKLKVLRHELTQIFQFFTNEAILHRDTPHDVGTKIKTDAERSRDDLDDVVTAAGKRLGEALRAIEEFMKTVEPLAAARVEALRYRFYDIEQRLAFTLHSSLATTFAKVRLYVLITESACKGDWFETAQLAIEGGADALQLREKSLDGAEFLARARRIVELCRSRQILSIINDRVDIAISSDADGVHVGQTDLPARDVRKLIGRQKLIGVSTHSIEQAHQAMIDGADYVGIGPVYRSPTKPRDILPGLQAAGDVVKQVRIPVVAIAGINAGNVDEVLATGVRAIAVTSAVTGADDPREAARALKSRLS